MPLAGKQTGPQGAEPEGGGGRGNCGGVVSGLRLAAGRKRRGWEVLGKQGGLGLRRC